MKLNEMNEHQRLATQFVWEEMSDWIGGCENAVDDYPEGSDEYESARRFLDMSHEEMKEFIYNEVMHHSGKEMDKHMRFAGKEFILERIDRRLTKWGY